MMMPTTTGLGQVSMHDQGSEGLLQCDICLTKLKDKRAYIVHMKKHAGTQSLKCRFCGLILQGQQKFNKHIRTNHNMDPNTVQAIVMDEPDPMEHANKDNDSSVSGSESFRQQSGRGSVASNFDHATVMMNPNSAAAAGGVKCALCPE